MPKTSQLTPAASILSTERIVATLANGNSVGVLASGLPVSTAQATADSAVATAAASDATTKANAAQAAAIAAAATDATNKVATEATTRATADTTLGNAITAETAARVAGDALKVPISIDPYNHTSGQTFIFEGDSLTVGVETPWTTLFPALPDVGTLISTTHVAAIGGSSLASIEDRYDTAVKPHRPTANGGDGGALVTLTVWIGANDYVGLATSGGVSTVAAWITRLSDYCQDAIEDGLRVVLFTVLRRANSLDFAQYEAVRAEINRQILLINLPLILVDVASQFPDPENLDLFLDDKVHLNAAAQYKVADLLRSSLRSSVATPWNKPLAVTDALEDSASRKNALVQQHGVIFSGGYGAVSVPALGNGDWSVGFYANPSELSSGDYNCIITGTGSLTPYFKIGGTVGWAKDGIVDVTSISGQFAVVGKMEHWIFSKVSGYVVVYRNGQFVGVAADAQDYDGATTALSGIAKPFMGVISRPFVLTAGVTGIQARAIFESGGIVPPSLMASCAWAMDDASRSRAGHAIGDLSGNARLTVLTGAADAAHPMADNVYTVDTLPAGTQGDEAYVTDATAPTYLGALTGGGAVFCPVVRNATGWVSH